MSNYNSYLCVFMVVVLIAVIPAVAADRELREENPTVEDVEASFFALIDRGEWLGFYRSADAPANNLPVAGVTSEIHFQGITRASRVGGRPILYVTRAGDPSKEPPWKSEGTLMVVEMGSRGTDGERMRSNRMLREYETQNTGPRAGDKVIKVIKLDHGGIDYYHPGGLQACGDVLAVALEKPNPGESQLGKVVFFNISNPTEPVLMPYELTFEDRGGPDGRGHDASAVGLAKFGDYHVLAVGYNDEINDRKALDLYVSNGVSFPISNVNETRFRFDHHTTLLESGELDFREQSFNLVVQGSDENRLLYLIGAKNLDKESPVFPGKNQVKLWRVHDIGLDQTGLAHLRKIGDRDIMLHSDGEDVLMYNAFLRQEANFSAGTGVYVSPTGELLYYATEYYFNHFGDIINCGWWANDAICTSPEQNYLRFAEIHHNKVSHTGTCGAQWRGDNPSVDHLGGPFTINEMDSQTIDGTVYYVEPWVHMFEEKNFDGACNHNEAFFLSYKCSTFMMDAADQGKDNFNFFPHLDGPKPLPTSENGFNNQLTSFRWCGAPGDTLILYNDSRYGTSGNKGYSHFYGNGNVLEEADIENGMPDWPTCSHAHGGVKNDHASSAQIEWTRPEETYTWSLGGDQEGTLTPSADGKQAVYTAGPGSSTNEVWLNIYGEDVHAIINVLNVPPEFERLEITSGNEGDEIVLSGSWYDPGATEVTFTIDWGDGSPVYQQLLDTTSFAFSHYYADNGAYTVTACINDSEDETCESVESIISNVPPTVMAGPDMHISESGSVVLAPATFNDKGTLDTHSAIIDWGDEMSPKHGFITESPYGPPGNPAGMNGTVDSAHTYGDNGLYTVDVCVTDDDGGTGCDMLQVQVDNVDPTLDLDETAAIDFLGGGPAFLARVHVSDIYSCDAGDVGSDDLTFRWDVKDTYFANIPVFTDSELYCNDPEGIVCPDALPSSQYHHFPMWVEDEETEAAFPEPGVYMLGLSVEDDDGGMALDRLPIVVTDDRACAHTRAYWRQQYRRPFRSEIERDHLMRYLHVIEFASPSFSEFLCTDRHNTQCLLKAVREVLRPAGPDVGDPHPSNMKGKAMAECVSSWLNFASGSVRWDDEVGRDGELFHRRMSRVEAILMDPDASHQDYIRATQLARNINRNGANRGRCKKEEKEAEGGANKDSDGLLPVLLRNGGLKR